MSSWTSILIGRKVTSWTKPSQLRLQYPSSSPPAQFQLAKFFNEQDSAEKSSFLDTFKRLLATIGLGVSIALGLYVVQDAYFLPSSFAYCREDSHDQNQPVVSTRFNFIAEAVEKAAPGVVYIETSRNVSTFYGHMTAMSSGSGFVVEDGNYVLTNAHVVSNALSVRIKLNTGEFVKGEVTDVDEVADLAIIKMDLPVGTSSHPLKFGNSDNLRPGEWVVAMGSPLTLTNTITCGIISTLHRPSKDLGLGYRDMEYVQTDAAITIGNSGGPLVNLDGEVIGINTMTAAPGISFAIPSTIAQNFVRSANKKATGKFMDARSNKKYIIGISMLTLDSRVIPTIQQYFSISKDITGGVLVTKVWPHSPAYLAGLKRGDVVVCINGKQIKTSNDMYKMVSSGEKLTIEYYRKNKHMTCTVVPAEAMS